MMPRPDSRLLLFLLAFLPLPAAIAQCLQTAATTRAVTFVQPTSSPVKPLFHIAGPTDATGSALQVFFNDLSPADEPLLLNALRNLDSWAILVDGNLSPVHVRSAQVIPGIVTLELTSSLGADTLASHSILLLFSGDPANKVQPGTVLVKVPKSLQTSPGAPASSGWHLPQLKLTTDKKDPNFDVTGSLQTAVGATPLYSWTVLARYPIEHTGPSSIFKLGPQFTGVASQQTNADPDSLSAAAAGELEFNSVCIGDRLLPIRLLFNPISYEFERKAKLEAVLTSGVPALHPYQQKNSNLIVSGGVQIVEGFLPVNVNLNLGTEFGASTSRSVLNTNAHPGYSDAPLRALAGADVYFNVPAPRSAKPLFGVVGHYTVRSLFHPEPFQQEGVNAGNQFYSTKARHSITIDLARTIVPGIDLNVQYRFGSLPPTFSFVDHQVNIGFEFLLGK